MYIDNHIYSLFLHSFDSNYFLSSVDLLLLDGPEPLACSQHIFPLLGLTDIPQQSPVTGLLVTGPAPIACLQFSLAVARSPQQPICRSLSSALLGFVLVLGVLDTGVLLGHLQGLAGCEVLLVLSEGRGELHFLLQLLQSVLLLGLARQEQFLLQNPGCFFLQLSGLFVRVGVVDAQQHGQSILQVLLFSHQQTVHPENKPLCVLALFMEVSQECQLLLYAAPATTVAEHAQHNTGQVPVIPQPVPIMSALAGVFVLEYAWIVQPNDTMAIDDHVGGSDCPMSEPPLVQGGQHPQHRVQCVEYLLLAIAAPAQTLGQAAPAQLIQQPRLHPDRQQQPLHLATLGAGRQGLSGRQGPLVVPVEGAGVATAHGDGVGQQRGDGVVVQAVTGPLHSWDGLYLLFTIPSLYSIMQQIQQHPIWVPACGVAEEGQQVIISCHSQHHLISCSRCPCSVPAIRSHPAQKQLINYTPLQHIITHYYPAMRPPASIALLLLLLLPLVMGVNYYTLAQQFHSQHFSDADISPAWVLSPGLPPAPLTSTCNGTRIVGGYGILTGHPSTPPWLTRTWTNLPPHYQVEITMKIYKIDSWQGEHMFIMLDGQAVDILAWDASTGTSDICGEPNPYLNPLNPQYNEYIHAYNTTAPHSAASLQLRLASSLNSWTGAWGIRELTIRLLRCHLSCLACSNSTQCTSCDAGQGLALVGQFCECGTGFRRLIQTDCPVSNCVSCVSTAFNCPAGYYNQNTTSCASCSPVCSSCQGPGALPPDCLSCSPARYIDPGTGVCTVCFGFCAACTGILANQCTSCLYGKYLLGGSCFDGCVAGYYGVESLALCQLCTSPCLACDGGTTSHCLTCVVGYYLYLTTCLTVCPASMYGYNGLCVPACPLGTYADASSICQPCPANCDTCDQTGKCTGCTPAAYFSPYDNLCYSPCLPTFYGDPTTRICTYCDASCLTCYGPTSAQCSSCFPGTFLVHSTCYSQCPPHTYSLTCQLCHDTCLNCTGPSPLNCLSCSQQYVYHVNMSTCLGQCLSGDVRDNENRRCYTCQQGQVGKFGRCEACAPSCRTCFDTGFMQCLSCHPVQQQVALGFLTIVRAPVVYLPSAETCHYADTPIIHMPDKTNSPPSLHQALFYLILINLVLALFLECVFLHKTNLLITVELMQLVAYLFYLYAPLSETNQSMLYFLYNGHPTALLTTHNLLPTFLQLFSLQGPVNASALPSKLILMGKSGLYLADTFYMQIVIGLAVVVFLVARAFRQSSGLYARLNPYLLGYVFRLIFMEMMLAGLLFLTYIDLDDTIMRVSLGIFVLNLLMIALSFFWKIRTELQPQHSHFALFYFNELGPRRASSVLAAPRSVLPSLIHYISRLPLVLTILLFPSQPLTQALCTLLYSIFLFCLNCSLQYRRRIYKLMTLWYYLGYMGCCGFVLMSVCGLEVGVGFELWVLGCFGGLLACTIGQMVTNHEFWAAVWGYGLAKYCTEARREGAGQTDEKEKAELTVY